MPEDPTRALAVVVPAKDEAARIGRVIQAALDAKLATEIVVVSDGSRDRTAEVARGFPGVAVIELRENLGKAAAMQAGVRATRAPFVLFVDADLEGLRGEHLDKIARPVLLGACDMCVGILRGGKKWSDAAQRVTPGLSGQRAMRREVFEAVQNVDELGMGIEVALNLTVKRLGARKLNVFIYGVSNAHKEQKLGWVKGVAARTRMFKEITEAMVNGDQRRKQARRRKAGSWWNAGRKRGKW